MSKWSKTPPTYEQWKDGNHHGMYWVKFLLFPTTYEKDGDHVITWSETWYVDVVLVTVEYEAGRLLNPKYARLYGKGFILGDFHLEDKEKTKNMYWQPIQAPYDDIRYEEPKLD
jgi:hypothetical protein